MNIFDCRVQVLVLFCAILVAADSDTRTVQAEFDRCHSVMERLERSLRRYEDAVGRIIRTVRRSDYTGKNHLRQEAASLENRLEYFRNRFERSRGQTDKITGDLKNVNGPTCPSCVESSVNMYCRNSETLQNSLDEHIIKADDLLNRLDSPSAPVGSAVSGKVTDVERQRAAIDTRYRSIESCSTESAIPLIRQAGVNMQRADSLITAGNENDARKALDIAGALVEKAAERCRDH
ncbi:MAG: hypothetical protein JW863_00405 [Chitinispirillaceae bacterium]|nr:hypothetical protein [Chitinispirillaceae bacterium]